MLFFHNTRLYYFSIPAQKIQHKEKLSKGTWILVADGWDFILQALHLHHQTIRKTGTGIITSSSVQVPTKETHGDQLQPSLKWKTAIIRLPINCLRSSNP